MNEFRTWLANAIDTLDGLYEHLEPHEGLWERCANIVHEAGDRAARLGLPELHRASREFSGMAEPQAVKTFLSACVGACKDQPSEPGPLDCKEAAVALGVSERVVRDLIASGELGSHRVGNGRGQVRILPRDLEAYQGRGERPALRHLGRG